MGMLAGTSDWYRRRWSPVWNCSKEQSRYFPGMRRKQRERIWKGKNRLRTKTAEYRVQRRYCTDCYYKSYGSRCRGSGKSGGRHSQLLRCNSRQHPGIPVWQQNRQSRRSQRRKSEFRRTWVEYGWGERKAGSIHWHPAERKIIWQRWPESFRRSSWKSRRPGKGIHEGRPGWICGLTGAFHQPENQRKSSGWYPGHW